ncbi:hypothetical protein BA190_09475 [Labrys sp. WJW]|uniref:hypothetical protein n=1 Tax=Labrys sp. WJW TaxID=1737983 RepID=UPI00082A7BD2|nr:hypothetical protein [Labrys sp. WJW]OCC05136.1 hypothetical protein BA190_09475 [Labrys sp. WJW]
MSIYTTPRMRIVWQVLEAAKDAGETVVLAACRRLVEADRRGWKRHANPADYQLVLSFLD